MDKNDWFGIFSAFALLMMALVVFIMEIRSGQDDTESSTVGIMESADQFSEATSPSGLPEPELAPHAEDDYDVDAPLPETKPGARPETEPNAETEKEPASIQNPAETDSADAPEDIYLAPYN